QVAAALEQEAATVTAATTTAVGHLERGGCTEVIPLVPGAVTVGEDDMRGGSLPKPMTSSLRGTTAAPEGRPVVAESQRSDPRSMGSGARSAQASSKSKGAPGWGAVAQEQVGAGSSSLSVQDAAEQLRMSATFLLAARREEQEAWSARLQGLSLELRAAQEREVETVARLEESRELSREQTSFVEGVWHERQKMERELGKLREEVQRLRAEEKAARLAGASMEARVAELSLSLASAKDQAKAAGEEALSAQAKAEARREVREAMDALRRQVDDLRGQSEFHRLRAKHEKAKGRIVILEEKLAGAQRGNALARREFQGALEALKLSQALLLRLTCGRRNRARSASRHLGNPGSPLASKALLPASNSSPDGGIDGSTTGGVPQPDPPVAQAGPLGSASLDGAPMNPAAAKPAQAMGGGPMVEEGMNLCDVSHNVRGLTQLATSETQG
ncbi:unnamed protein product, partial [Discosporangium mesarthrocarpum]